MTPAWWWGLILDAAGLGTALLLAHRIRFGWLFGIFNMLLWTAYALATTQWGFFPGIAAFLVVDLRGWRKWKP